MGAVSALYDYEAQQEEEVTFAEGDTMVLYDKDDPDWYLVKLENGEIGLAPSNYLEEVGILALFVLYQGRAHELINLFRH